MKERDRIERKKEILKRKPERLGRGMEKFRVNKRMRTNQVKRRNEQNRKTIHSIIDLNKNIHTDLNKLWQVNCTTIVF